MAETNEPREEPSPIGWIVALALFLLPGFAELAYTGPHSWDFALLRGAVIAIPFAYLGLRGTAARRPWLITIGLTFGIWATSFAILAVTPESPGILGIETLLGLVILVSPVFVIAVARSSMQSTKRPSA